MAKTTRPYARTTGIHIYMQWFHNCHGYMYFQDKLRLATLRQRTYTRLKLREQIKDVEGIEQQVVLAYQQLTAVNKENKRYVIINNLL